MNPRGPAVLLPALVLAGSLALVIASARESRPPVPSASYEFGRGPTVVLVHGLGSRVEDWLPAARSTVSGSGIALSPWPGSCASTTR